MRVFLSWSGTTSHKVALALRDWLPAVIQSLRPYVSSEDIDKGTRWSTDIAKELEASTYGILCITSSNVEAPWITFEAGALSKAIDKSHVTPFLFRMKRSEVKGPLLQFQSVIYEKDDILKLLTSINGCLPPEDHLEEAQLKRFFEVWWPELQKSLDAIPNEDTTSATPTKAPAQSAILEELLELARSQQKLLRNPEELLPAPYLDHVFRRVQRHDINSDELHEAVDEAHDLVVQLVARLTKAPQGETLPTAELLDAVERIHILLHRALGRTRRPFRRAPAPEKAS